MLLDDHHQEVRLLFVALPMFLMSCALLVNFLIVLMQDVIFTQCVLRAMLSSCAVY